jgi:exopolysaccharide biosynthesis polyprenyl glycosylphosphotransferase
MNNSVLSQQLDVPVPAPSLMVSRHLAIFLVIGDLGGLFFSLILAYFLQFGELHNPLSKVLLGILALAMVVFYIGDAYRPDLQVSGLWAPARTLICCLILGFLLAALSYLLRTTAFTQLTWRAVLLPGLGLFTVWAVLLRAFACAIAQAHAKQSTCLLLGANEDTVRFEHDFAAWNPQGKLVILADPSDLAREMSDHPRRLCSQLDELPLWSAQSWSGVVVASPLQLTNQETQHLLQLRCKGTPVYQLPNFYETVWQKLPSRLLKDNWLAFGHGFDLVASRASFKAKRIVDVMIATLLLLSLLPLLVLTAVAIKCESAGPIFYSQMRNGQNAIPFRVYKFRSMFQNAEKQGAQWAQKRDPRVTRVGYWLRLMRIDELPQLWNVLNGEMSLVGPRPERPEFDTQLAEQIPYYTLRYLVKPGITGWAQVRYPYGASVEDAYEKLAYDLYYIKNYSIWLDLIIVFQTIRVVLLGKGR